MLLPTRRSEIPRRDKGQALRSPVASNEASAVLPVGSSRGGPIRGTTRANSWDEYLLSGWMERDANREQQAGRSGTLRPALAGVGTYRGRKDSAEKSVGFHPEAGATRAREPERVWGGPSPSGDGRFQGPALRAAGWVRRRRSKDFTRLALMPCAEESDVDAPASLLQRQYDRSSSRKFQSLRNCANPYCCCSRRRPSLRLAVTASVPQEPLQQPPAGCCTTCWRSLQ